MEGIEAQSFFENYLRHFLSTITAHGADLDAAHAKWCACLHPMFVSVSPWGHVTGAAHEAVLCAWRHELASGCYSVPCIVNFRIQEHSASCIDCCAVLGRRYGASNQGATQPCELSRNVLHLRATGMRCPASGRLSVAVHFYSTAPPEAHLGITSRSQIKQDLWVLQHFGKVSDGFFLEIGANHPEQLSNTYLLEKAAHWKGVCIEPFPQGDWSTRSAQLVRTAVGPDGATLSFIAPGHVLGGLLSSVDLPRVERQVPAAERPVVEVSTRTLPSILLEAFQDERENLGKGGKRPVIHYLSLDTEGSEFEILSAFPFDDYTLLSITVEHNFVEPSRTRIRELLEGRGFVKVAPVEHDDFYLFKDYTNYL